MHRLGGHPGVEGGVTCCSSRPCRLVQRRPRPKTYLVRGSACVTSRPVNTEWESGLGERVQTFSLEVLEDVSHPAGAPLPTPEYDVGLALGVKWVTAESLWKRSADPVPSCHTLSAFSRPRHGSLSKTRKSGVPPKDHINAR